MPRSHTPTPPTAGILTLREAATYLHISPATMYRLLKKSRLPGFKVGNDWRFDKSQLDRWRREQERKQ